MVWRATFTRTREGGTVTRSASAFRPSAATQAAKTGPARGRRPRLVMNPLVPPEDPTASSSLEALDFFGHNLVESKPVLSQRSHRTTVAAEEPATQHKPRLVLEAAPTGFELIRRAAMRRASEPVPTASEVMLARLRIRHREGRNSTDSGEDEHRPAAQRLPDAGPDAATSAPASEAASNAWGRVRSDVMRRASEQMTSGIGLLQARQQMREGRRTFDAPHGHGDGFGHERRNATQRLSGPGLDEVTRLLLAQRDVRRPRRPPEHEQASQVEAAQPARESFHQLLARQQEARRARERQHRDPDALEHLLAMHRDSIINRRQWWSAPLG